jgi:hypothetical protein
MHFWNTSKLASEIVADRVTARDKAWYFVFGQVFWVATGYAASLNAPQGLWFYVYEGVVVAVVTFAGAGKVLSTYGKSPDATFFEMIYVLSVPLMIKATLAAWTAIYGGSWLFLASLPYASPTSAESALALSYWLGRLWQVFPFVVAVVIAAVDWSRLNYHVAYIVKGRGA